MATPKKTRKTGLSAIELLEQAVHLLRTTPLSVLLLYYLGTVPFVLGFLYFWSDMSRSAFAEQHHVIASLGIALLFFWMKTWQAIFCAELRSRLSTHRRFQWNFRNFVRAAMIQVTIQPSGLFILPVALVITLPFSWTYAFYQNASSLGADSSGIKHCFHQAAKQSRLWQKQNHLVLGILSLFGFFIFLNIVSAFVIVPGLIKMFFGIETVFTKGGAASILNTTFLAATLAVSYLCIDPLVKSIYVLRCFYGESIGSGEDLKAELMRGKLSKTTPFHAVKKIAVAAILLFLVHSSPAADAKSDATLTTVSGSKPAVSADDLNRSIGDVMNRREFTWRMPREKIKPTAAVNKNFFQLFIEGIEETVSRWARKARDLSRGFAEWWEKHFGGKKKVHERSSESSSTADWMTNLQIFIYILLALVLATIVILILRLWKHRRRHETVVAQAVAIKPDLTDENVVADQLPEDGWLKMARELIEQGNLRLALRALYLASLAHLADRQMISIAKFKSNRDYELELRRRARSLADLQTAFSQNVGIFDRVWYGMHEVTNESLESFQSNFERIRSC